MIEGLVQEIKNLREEISEIKTMQLLILRYLTPEDEPSEEERKIFEREHEFIPLEEALKSWHSSGCIGSITTSR
ncbi:hypothetical protein IPdc08_00067 [archaeon]|nr:hypothetical protein IPdc08_00067 [archaeon]